VVIQSNCHQLAEWTATLLSKQSLNEVDIAELKQVDKELTTILVKADQQCHSLSSIPWSPMVQQAYLLHQYWVLQQMAKCTECDLSAAIKQITNRLDLALSDDNPNISLSAKLRKAQQVLSKAKWEVDQLCHLTALLTAANQTKCSKH